MDGNYLDLVTFIQNLGEVGPQNADFALQVNPQ
jgi:hypothetical protein